MKDLWMVSETKVKFVILVTFILFFINIVSAFPDTMRVNIQAEDGGTILPNQAFLFNFSITINPDCTGILYNIFTIMTTDSRGIVTYQLKNVSMEFNDSLTYFCYYRDNVLKLNTSFSFVAYAGYAKNVSWAGVVNRPTNLSQFIDDILVNSTYNLTYDSKADYNFTNNNFNGSGSFTTTENVTASWFHGLYDWIISSLTPPSYATFNGTTLWINNTFFYNQTIPAIDYVNGQFYNKSSNLNLNNYNITNADYINMIGDFLMDKSSSSTNASMTLNSGINLYSCIDLTEGAGTLGFRICNDGSGVNRFVISNHETGFEYFMIDRDNGEIILNNKTSIASDLNVTGNIGTGGYLEFQNISTPGNPLLNSGRLYIKDDGSETNTTKIYYLDYNGIETELGAGGGGGCTDLECLIDVSGVDYTNGYTLVADGSGYISRRLNITELGDYSNFSVWLYNQTADALNLGQGMFLNLSGTNANQSINFLNNNFTINGTTFSVNPHTMTTRLGYNFSITNNYLNFTGIDVYLINPSYTHLHLGGSNGGSIMFGNTVGTSSNRWDYGNNEMGFYTNQPLGWRFHNQPMTIDKSLGINIAPSSYSTAKLIINDTLDKSIVLHYDGYNPIYLRNYQGQFYIYHGTASTSPRTYWDINGNMKLSGNITVEGTEVIINSIPVARWLYNQTTPAIDYANGFIKNNTNAYLNTLGIGTNILGTENLLEVSGNARIQGNLTVFGSLSYLNIQDLILNGSLIPKQDALFDIGNDTNYEWRYGFFSNDINISGIGVKQWLYNQTQNAYFYNQTQSAYFYNMTQNAYFYNMTSGAISIGDLKYLFQGANNTITLNIANITNFLYNYNTTQTAYFYNMSNTAYFYNQTQSAYFYNMTTPESDPNWKANFTNMQIDCDTNNGVYGIYNNGTFKCREFSTGGGSSTPYTNTTIVDLDILLIPNSAVAWSNQPVNTTELYGNTQYRKYFDLSNAVEYRIIHRASVVGHTTAYLNTQYSTNSGSTWVNLNTTNCKAFINITIGTTLPSNSPWCTITSDAQKDVMLRIVGGGGNGASDPAFRYIGIQFKVSSLNSTAYAIDYANNNFYNKSANINTGSWNVTTNSINSTGTSYFHGNISAYANIDIWHY